MHSVQTGRTVTIVDDSCWTQHVLHKFLCVSKVYNLEIGPLKRRELKSQPNVTVRQGHLFLSNPQTRRYQECCNCTSGTTLAPFFPSFGFTVPGAHKTFLNRPTVDACYQSLLVLKLALTHTPCFWYMLYVFFDRLNVQNPNWTLDIMMVEECQ